MVLMLYTPDDCGLRFTDCPDYPIEQLTANLLACNVCFTVQVAQMQPADVASPVSACLLLCQDAVRKAQARAAAAAADAAGVLLSLICAANTFDAVCSFMLPCSCSHLAASCLAHCCSCLLALHHCASVQQAGSKNKYNKCARVHPQSSTCQYQRFSTASLGRQACLHATCEVSTWSLLHGMLTCASRWCIESDGCVLFK